MNHLNSVLLEGILATDPEVVATSQNNRRLVKFILASDRYYVDKAGKTQQETVFIPVQCWGKLGEMCLSLMKKGMLSRCVGRLQMCTWKSKVNGESRQSIQIVCDHLEYKPKIQKKETAEEEELKILEDLEKESDFLSETVVLYEF